MLANLARALSFLTRLPVRARWDSPDALARSAGAFPLAGALVGGAVAAVAWAAALVLPLPAAAFAALAFAYALTGALHADGLADTADGLACLPDREKALAAMAEPQVGSHGALALALVVVGKHAAFLGTLDARAWGLFVAAGAASRWALVLVPALTRYATDARRHAGMSAAYFAGVGVREQATGVVLAAAACWLALGVAGLVAMLAAGVATVVVARRLARGLGGATGDGLGAAAELAELAALLVGLATLPRMPAALVAPPVDWAALVESVFR